MDLINIPCTDCLLFLNPCLQLEPQLRILANFRDNPNNNPNPSRLPTKEINSLLILLSDFLQADILQEIKLVASHVLEKPRKEKFTYNYNAQEKSGKR